MNANDRFFSLQIKMYSRRVSSFLRLNSSLAVQCRSFFDKTYINGQWVSSESGETFKVFNPSTGEEIGSVPDCDNRDAEKAIQAAHRTFQSQWSIKTGKERSVIMKKFNDLLLKNKNKLGEILTKEMVRNSFDINRSKIFTFFQRENHYENQLEKFFMALGNSIVREKFFPFSVQI